MTMKDIKINVRDYIEFNTTHKEKVDLINYILFELTSSSDYQKFIKEHLKGLLQTELENKNDARLIEAYKTIISSKLSC